MVRCFAVHCRLNPATGEIEMLGVEATNDARTASDVRPVSEELAARCQLMIDRNASADRFAAEIRRPAPQLEAI